ncbi:hypothetical protein A3A60_04555 [Candidatus Curtissbacteria bacterium RIFCSPLOWO2_01_FULL_42_26]|uniref:Uncharacterized protein n=1 Tax=Candidatus Curtissbacteria bacterium RIFCSPLOWO2_01_FULL_42_26 TaxID=1797729 RepID=A0A1F5HX53_9BACT|nr:MAG: hypothetical protein A3A60_04555 [Candidatus Curtissbacteria bacterium RIFCSPLOWO2_01_FULL_42_26]
MGTETKGASVMAAEIDQAVNFFRYRDLDPGRVLDFLTEAGWTVELRGGAEQNRSSVVLIDNEAISRHGCGRRIIFNQAAKHETAFYEISAIADYVEEKHRCSRSGIVRTDLIRVPSRTVQSITLVSRMSIDFGSRGVRDLILETIFAERVVIPLEYRFSI